MNAYLVSTSKRCSLHGIGIISKSCGHGIGGQSSKNEGISHRILVLLLGFRLLDP